MLFDRPCGQNYFSTYSCTDRGGSPDFSHTQNKCCSSRKPQQKQTSHTRVPCLARLQEEQTPCPPARGSDFSSMGKTVDQGQIQYIMSTLSHKHITHKHSDFQHHTIVAHIFLHLLQFISLLRPNLVNSCDKLTLQLWPRSMVQGSLGICLRRVTGT